MKYKLTGLVALASLLIFAACHSNARVDLFNGKDLTNWVLVVDSLSEVPAAEVFSVVDGNIRIAGLPMGYMRTAESYGDYTLHAQWRWVGDASNSGLFQRLQPGDGLWPNTIECQLHAGDAGDLLFLGGAKVEGVEMTGKFPMKKRLGAADCEKPVGEWNDARIECRGGEMKVYINDQLQNECSGTNTSGYIALQSEGGPVEFRNVYLTDIKQ